MARPGKGEKTPGSGRQPGTPNKKTQSLMEMCEARGFSPFGALLELAQFAEDNNLRFNALKEVSQYLYPKRRAIEHSGKIDTGLLQMAEAVMGLSDEELAEKAKEAAEKLK